MGFCERFTGGGRLRHFEGVLELEVIWIIGEGLLEY